MDLASLKRKYRIIFCTQIGSRLIYWRPLTLREHDIYTKIFTLGLSSKGKVEDLIFQDIVLDPLILDQMNLLPPGIVPSIVGAAMMVSGNNLDSDQEMNRMNTDLDQIRDSISDNPYEQFIMLICKAFPKYTPSDIEQLEYYEMLRLLAMAEQIIGLEEPIKLKRQGSKEFTDRLFEDARRGEFVDHGAPRGENIKDVLVKNRKIEPGEKLARQIEMERIIRSRSNR
jgi:hypothetical protein